MDFLPGHQHPINHTQLSTGFICSIYIILLVIIHGICCSYLTDKISHLFKVYIFTSVWKRLSGFVVGFRTLGDVMSHDFLDYEICHIHSGSLGNGQTADILCHVGGPTHARYVSIHQLGILQVLTLCEVEVFEFTGKKVLFIYFILNWITSCHDSNNRARTQISFENKILGIFAFEFREIIVDD